MTAAARAQDPVRLSVGNQPVEIASDGVATVRVSLEIAAPYHIYSTIAQINARGSGPIATSVAARSGGPVVLAGAPVTSPARKYYDPSFELDVLALEGRAWIDVPIRATGKLAPGVHRGELLVGYQACNEESCLPPAESTVAFLVRIPGEAVAATDDPRWRELEKRLAAPLPGAADREREWQDKAELAWTLFEAYPADPRRWAAWDSLLRSTPRFTTDAEKRRQWAERDAQLETLAAATTDVPETLQELFAGRKVSALVLPYTNGRLPDDWPMRLVPSIEDLATRFPRGSAAFVYFSRLVSAVESQAPAALPRLVERMEASANSRVRELAGVRRRVLAALAEPLALQFTALDGRSIDTTQWRGKVVLVDFWATWCVPCIEAVPHLKELYARYHDRGLEIISISVDQAAAKPALEKLVAKLELPWPQAFDGQGPKTGFAVRYGVQPIPHVLLAGPDGRIIAVNPAGEKLETEIKRLLKL